MDTESPYPTVPLCKTSPCPPFLCFSCVSLIEPNPDYPWMASYRAVYLNPDGTKLSDVAVADFDWLEEYLEVPPSDGDAEKYGPWYDKAQDNEAFLFHESCWPALVKHFANGEVDLNRLFEVCKNIPGSASPVLDTGMGKEVPWHPLERPIVRGIGDATKKLPKVKRQITDSRNNPTSRTDCFGLLAMEIRLEIAAYLSTVDFFSLRYASRAMALLFQLQSFWKTRFRVNGDRGFLACLAEAPQNRKRKDWRSIYHCTAKIDQPHLQLWTLRRIWRNNQWLVDRCSMVEALDDQPRPQNNLLGGVSWKEASTMMRCDRTFQQGQDSTTCQSCWGYHYAVVQTVSLQKITGLAVSILPEGTKTYITGFDLISADVGTPNIIFGYRLPGKQVSISLRGQELRGFDVFLGEGGIQAIRPIFNTNINTRWIGETEGKRDCSLTQIILEDEIKAILGKFDYCKMVSLCIA